MSSNSSYKVTVTIPQTVADASIKFIGNGQSESELARKLTAFFKDKGRAFSGEDILGLKPVTRNPKNDQNYLKFRRHSR